MGEKYVFAWFVGRAAHTPTHTHDTCHTVTRAIYKRGLEHVKAELSKPIVRYHSGVAAAIAYSHTYKCGAHTSTGLSKSSVCTTLVVAAQSNKKIRISKTFEKCCSHVRVRARQTLNTGHEHRTLSQTILWTIDTFVLASYCHIVHIQLQVEVHLCTVIRVEQLLYEP